MAMRKISSFTEDHFQRSHLELRILKGGRTDSQVMNGKAFSDKKPLLRKQVYQSLKNYIIPITIIYPILSQTVSVLNILWP